MAVAVGSCLGIALHSVKPGFVGFVTAWLVSTSTQDTILQQRYGKNQDFNFAELDTGVVIFPTHRTMCLHFLLPDFGATATHDNIQCVNTVALFSDTVHHTMTALFTAQVQNNGKSKTRLSLVYLIPPKATVESMSATPRVGQACAAIETLVNPETPANVWVYRGLSADAPCAMECAPVRVLEAPDGGIMIPVPCVAEQLETNLSALFNKGAYGEINDMLVDALGGMYGFEPVPVTADAMDDWLQQVHVRATQAMALKLVHKIYEAVLQHGNQECLELLFGAMEDHTTMFDTQGLLSSGSATESHHKVLEMRTTLMQHVNAQIMLYCTGELDAGASSKACFKTVTPLGSHVPMVGHVHNHGNESTETNILLFEQRATMGTSLLNLGKLANKPVDMLYAMPCELAWNGAPELAAMPHDVSRRLCHQQDTAREDLQARAAEDGFSGYVLSAARRIAGDVPLRDYVLDVPMVALY